jgi:hypothetical protein
MPAKLLPAGRGRFSIPDRYGADVGGEELDVVESLDGAAAARPGHVL